MKSTVQTVLAPVTLKDKVEYSSGKLDVSGLSALALDATLSYNMDPMPSILPVVTVSRVGLDGEVYHIGSLHPGGRPAVLSIGAGLQSASLFGDQVQIDLENPEKVAVSGTISLWGK